MHFQYTVFGPLDEFHGFIQICYYECPHISGIYLESLLNASIRGFQGRFSEICLSVNMCVTLPLTCKNRVRSEGQKYFFKPLVSGQYG